MNRPFAKKGAFFLVIPFATMLSVVSVPLPAVADVEIKFSDYLGNIMDEITYHEKKREKSFREFHAEGSRSDARARRFSYRNHRIPGWANEALIPDFDDFDVPSLIKAMMEKGVKEANPKFDGTITVNVGTLRLVNFPFMKINSSRTRMVGDVLVKNADGDVTAEHHIVAYLSSRYSRSRFYDGPEYVYQIAAANTRIGPIAAKFTEKALEKIFPDYDAPGPYFM